MVRMSNGDPADVLIRQLINASSRSYVLGNMHITALDIVIAYEEDTPKIMGFVERRDLNGLMHYLERGRTVYEGEPAVPVIVRK
jgi:hypothetical protein